MSETFGTTVQNTTVAPAGERCDNFQGNFQCILRKGHAPPHSVDLGTFTAVTIGNGPKPKDPLQESLAAIRDAITSRDRHFDALAEQLRQGFEAQITHQDANEMRIALARDLHLGQMEELRELVSSGKQHVINTILNSHETFRAELASANEWAVNVSERLKVLGAQLEGIERHFTLGPSWTQGFTTAAKQYNLELTQHLKAILSQLTESKRPRKPAGRKKAKR